MDKSHPRWVMVQERNSPKHSSYRPTTLEPLKHCSDAVAHSQLISAMKYTTDKPEPDMRRYDRDHTRIFPSTISPTRAQSTFAPPYPYPGAPVKGLGRNIHHLSKNTNDRIQSALEQRKRTLYMKQHENWSLPIYGNFAQRENHMKGYREYLKTQMEEKCWKKRQDFTKSVQNTKRSWEENRKEIAVDQEKDVTKRKNRRVIRDENKKLMEATAAQRRTFQQQELAQERNLIKLDPINWSRTLR